MINAALSVQIRPCLQFLRVYISRIGLAGSYGNSIFKFFRTSVLFSIFITLFYIPPTVEEGNGNPLQCSCMENPRDRGAWWVTVYGITQNQTGLKRLSSSTSNSTRVFQSVQFSRSVVSDSLWPHESQHARPSCLSPPPGVNSNSRPSSQWCHPTISSSVVPLASCPKSLPASESFPMSQIFPWGGQRTGVSALASFPPKNTQEMRTSPLGWTGLISLQSKGLSGVFSNTTVQKHQFFGASQFFLHSPTLTSVHDHWKNHRLD